MIQAYIHEACGGNQGNIIISSSVARALMLKHVDLG